MKHTLLILTFITTLASCEEVEMLYEQNTGEYTTFAIDSGKHFSYPIMSNLIESGDTFIHKEKFIANDSWYYEGESDWNKLGGVIALHYGNVHAFSLRFGWRCLNGVLEIGYYDYLPFLEEPIKGSMFEIEPYVEYEIEITYSAGCITHKVYEHGYELGGYSYIDDRLETVNHWWINMEAGFYFGGNNTAPHEVTVDKKSDHFKGVDIPQYIGY
jgi:hypothetical protein